MADQRFETDETGARRFRGSIVSRAWIRGVFWDRVDVDHHRIVLRAWLRRVRVIEREDVDAVGFQDVTLPLMWTWHVRFLRSGHDVVPLLFTPAAKQRFRHALEDLDWPTVDLAPMSVHEFIRGR